MKKRVLFLINTLNGGGAEKVLVDIVNHLNKEKFDIHVKTIYHEGIYISKLKPHVNYTYMVDQSSSIKRMWFHRLLNRLPMTIFYRLFIREKYDVEVAFLEGLPTKIISGSTNSFSYKIAWIHTDMKAFSYADAHFAHFEDHVQAYKRFNEILCVSESAKKSFIEKYGGFSTIDVQYNPIDSGNVLLRSQENITDILIPRTFKMVSVGRLGKAKGYDRLLAACRRLAEDGFEFQLWLIGEGKQRKNLEEYIKGHSLNNYVKLLGFKENPYKYMSQCDLFVCSSRAEGYSLVIAEAMILGLPVISVNCSGPNELLEQGKWGLLTENNGPALYNGLKAMMLSKQRQSFYKKRASLRGNQFDINETIQEIEARLEGQSPSSLPSSFA